MKRFIFIIGILFFIASPSLAWNTAAMSGGGERGTLCPPFYADTNVVLSWIAAGGGDTGVACDSSGNSVTVTEVGAVDIGTYEGETAMAINNADYQSDYLRIDQTTGQYLSMNSDQTLCLYVYVNDTALDQNLGFLQAWEAVDPDTDGIEIRIATNEYLACSWITESGNHASAGGLPSYQQWITIACSWDESGDLFAANPGDFASPNWEGGWEVDADALAAPTEDIDDIYIGPYSDPVGDGETHYIKQWVLVDQYGASSYDCTDLTGW